MSFWARLRGRAPRQEVVESPPDERGGYYVPADTTLSQILDYVSGTGDVEVLGDLAVASAGGALSYTALNRAITVLTGMISRVIVETAQVVDADGNRSTGPRAETALRLVRQTPDGGMCAAYTFHEDALSDLLTDGNVLVRVMRDARDRPRALARALPWGSYATRVGGSYVYQLRMADSGFGKVEPVALAYVAHGRFGRIRRTGANSGSTRHLFATPPVQVLRRAASTGIAADRHIQRYFTDGGTQAASVGVEFQGAAPTMTQAAELRSWFKGYRNSRDPLLVPFAGAKLVGLTTPAQTEADGKLREYQVRDVTRIYGVPAPVLGEQITSWGQGIAELARMTWRFGARQHADRYLEALGLRMLRPGDRFLLDPSEFTRPDPAQLSNLISAMLGGTPFGSVVEARRMVGLPRDADGELPERREGGTGPQDDAPAEPVV